jgi:peptidoglycan LD-endopeptidase LytH
MTRFMPSHRAHSPARRIGPLRAGVCLVATMAAAACARPSTTAAGAAPSPAPGPVLAGAPSSAGAAAAADAAYLRARRLVLPVAGVGRSRIRDSFDEARDGGARTHRAIDILAPRRTPVLSADDGIVLRLTTSAKGGISLYAADAAERVVYYYAHLDGYHPRLAQGALLAKGDTIGYVGTTGNAPKDVPHLHFQVMRMRGDGRFWDGEPINPYAFLVEAATEPAERERAGRF